MANEYPTTLYSRLVIALNGIDGPEYFQAGDSLMKPGSICMHDDGDEVKQCTTAGFPFGIIGCDADHDLSTVYTEGERIPVWVIGCGVDIFVYCKDADAKTILFGTLICTSDAIAGVGSMQDPYVDTVERTDSWNFVIGRALVAGTLSAGAFEYVPVKLSL